MKDADEANARKLPRIPKEHIPYILRAVAEKIERGDPLPVGEIEPGVRHMEGDIVAAVLRAVADGRSPVKALAGNGPPRRPRHELLRRLRVEMQKHGTQARAIEAIAKADRKRVPAVKADVMRAAREERESWRRKYMAGRWPDFRYWLMTDADIDAQVEMDRTGCNAAGDRVDFQKRYVDREGNEVDPLTMYRRLRDAEMKAFTKATGWISPPPRGDKTQPG